MRARLEFQRRIVAASSIVATLCALHSCSVLVDTNGLSGGVEPDAGKVRADASEAAIVDPDGPIPPADAEAGGMGAETAEENAPSTDALDAEAETSDTLAPDVDDSQGEAADTGIADAGPSESGDSPGVDGATACQEGGARVFVTATVFGGNLGGVAGADGACMAAATAAKLGGAWNAWISDQQTLASEHVYKASGMYVLPNGAVVGTFGMLVSGTLTHPIGITERGVSVPDTFTSVWTGMDQSAVIRPPGYCDGDGGPWTSNSRLQATFVGALDAVSSAWTNAYTQSCDALNARLYCFERCQ
jgi:hypothetical protein